MKPAERDENRANLGRFAARIAELEERRDDLSTQIAAIALDAALGTPEAVAQESAAKQELAGIGDQIATLQRAVDRLEADWAADAPLRDAERQAEEEARLRKEVKPVARAHIVITEKAHALAQELATTLQDRERSRTELQRFASVINAARLPPLGDILLRALTAAGLDPAATKFELNPIEPNSFSEIDALALADALPPDHPAILADRLKAEQRRQIAAEIDDRARREREEERRRNGPMDFDAFLEEPGVTLHSRRG